MRTKPPVRLPRSGQIRRLALTLCACALALTSSGERLKGQPRSESVFAARIEQLSEPGGYFDTDNLVSNEQSYLHALDGLRQRGVSGGVYIGVGPDQNFSYIALVRPALVFIVDIRRDNMLLHLLFKALFALSRDRAEYLSLLFGRPPPGSDQGKSREEWRDAGIRALIQYVDSVRPEATSVAAIRKRIDRVVTGFGLSLTSGDRETIDRFHRTFIEAGLSVKFQSTGRAPRSVYPTYRELLLENDRSGHEGNYLATEAAFQFVKSLQAKDLVIPVVGNLAGDRALASIARLMAARGERLSAFYTSNVELYLSQDGLFPRFVANLTKLPHDHRSVVIRSVFGTTIAESVPGYYSTSVVQPVAELLEGYEQGRFRSYWSVIQSR